MDCTVAALPVLIEFLQGKGYQFVTVPELITRSRKEPFLHAMLSSTYKKILMLAQPAKPAAKPE